MTKSKKVGVYQIRCQANGKIYVGSSSRIYQRWHTHRSELGNRLSGCIILQRAWTKYGAENFTFKILEECGANELVVREQYWIDLLHPALNSVREVKRRFSPRVLEGIVYTDGKTERKFLKDEPIPEGFTKGRVKWPEERKAGWTGASNPMNGKNGAAHHLFGTKRTPEQSSKQSESMKARYAAGLIPHNKGVPQPDEAKGKNRQAHLGRHHTEASKIKCAEAGRKAMTPEHKQKLAEVHDAKSPGRGTTIMTCKVCGKDRRVNLSQVKLGNGHFCSLSCRTKFQMTTARAQAMLDKRWAAPRS